ncbi:Non-specific serine/threonine protein kinase [Bertholletia excelsa]
MEFLFFLVSAFSILSLASDSRGNSTSVLGYTCNGLHRRCSAYLTFRSRFPYNTVSSISQLLGANASRLSHLNSVDQNATFETDKVVLVPVKCSCTGQYYQANTTYIVVHGDTPYLIARNIFQGLSTYQAIKDQKSKLTKNIYTGDRLTVPLRCACPTKNQSDAGVKSLLSYLVTSNQYVSLISSMFGVDTGMTLLANRLSEEEDTIYPFSTLLIPLQKPPSVSQLKAPPPPPASQPPPPPTAPPKNRPNITWAYVVIGTLGGALLLLVIGIIIFCVFFYKLKGTKRTNPIRTPQSSKATKQPSGKKLEEQSQDFLASLSVIAQSLKIYTFEELQSATDNFNPSCRIRGSVYRGTINGDSAAIKKMDGDVSNEVNLLTKMSHFNLIRLSGVCFSEGHWYLVYEYAVNGPLKDWIYHNNPDQKFLNWTKRMQIALDVATGLNYIHNYASPPHVHKDVNSSNVLLDSEFRAKIANFGLSRLVEEEAGGEFAQTRHIVGTKGYMAPEYIENGFVSTKLDVYSFGVLMLEILTGKEVAELYDGVNVHLSEVLAVVFQEENGKENLRNFMDPSFEGNYPAELAVHVARLIDACLIRDPSGRPGMDEIVQSLSIIITTSSRWESSNITSVRAAGETEEGIFKLIASIVNRKQALSILSMWLALPFMISTSSCSLFVQNCLLFAMAAEFLLCFFMIFLFLTSDVYSQQRYSGNSAVDCNNSDGTGPSPAFLYSCNGQRKSCKAFLIFRSLFPYNSVSTISNLTSSDPLELARTNNVSISSVFPPNQEVIVPVSCSCSGWYYQANTTYVTPTIYETYFIIANNTYQGLSTCSILMRENVYGEFDIGAAGLKLKVPLRCACPTRNQAVDGTKFLLTYLVTWGDSVPGVSKRFNVSARSVAFANGFSEDPDLFPFTTILIPLLSQTIIHHPPPFYSPPSLPPPRLEKRESTKEIYAGIGAGISVLLLCFVLFVGFLLWRRNRVHGKGKKEQVESRDLRVHIAKVGRVMEVYKFKELEAATENFSSENKLSDSIHRGILHEGVVAIKRMSSNAAEEVKILKRFNHFNLISLYGACEHQGVFYLVYEFMKNGSLRDWLHKNCLEHHSWNHRIQIALDVANGLHYLHNFTYPAYVHKDINSNSVLLSRNLRAKIANFSLARSAEQGENLISSARCALRMKGYVAPEYIEAGLVTPMMDVYAFGVVLLELVSGRDAVFQQDGKEIMLSEAVLSVMEGGNAESEIGNLVDPRLQVKNPLGYTMDQSELALRLVKLGVACLEEPEDRMNIGEVVSALRRIQLDADKWEYQSI